MKTRKQYLKLAETYMKRADNLLPRIMKARAQLTKLEGVRRELIDRSGDFHDAANYHTTSKQ